MSNHLQRVILKPTEENSGNASHCVSGCVYQVVQTIGLDGKNLLQLLPIPNSSGNTVPLVQSSVMSDALKGNTGNPVQVTFQTQISSSSKSTSVPLPIFQPASSSSYLLPRTVDTAEKGRVSNVGTENFTTAASNVKSHAVKMDGLNMQTFAVPPSSTQNDSSYVVVNSQSLPMKSSVLPSGHHLQIPAHAEVKSVPASSLPPSVQQKILGTATASTSGAVETSQIPTVIYVSPVNTVKNVVTKSFQNIYPKPVKEIAKPTMLSTTPIPTTVTTETQLKNGQHSQPAPVKFIFQENLQPSASALIPVKSSNNVASKILKTFVDRKNLCDTINMPPLKATNSSAPQSISVPIKDNALVMFNGKVYLLAKKGADVLLSQSDQQNSVSPDTPLRKDASQLVNSSTVTEISREVVNIVLAKSKSCQMETKSLSNSHLASMANIMAEKNKNVQKPSLSTTEPYSMNQSNNYLNQSKTVFAEPVFAHGFSTGHNAPRKENAIQSIEKISSSVDATTVTSQQCVFRDQELKIHNEMASILEKDTQERNEKKDSQGRSNKASYLKSDAEFRKIFGITRDLRVCLTPVDDYLDSGESSVSFSSSVNSSTLKETDLMVKEEERNQNLDKKRKLKTPKKMDYTKRRKTKNSGNTAINGGANATSSQFLSSVLPTSDVLQCDIVTSHSKTGEDKRTETEHCTSEKQEEQVVLSSNVVFEQGHSFSKNYTEDMFPTTLPELEETIREEKIRRLKQVLREKEAALEEMRKKMHQK